MFPFDQENEKDQRNMFARFRDERATTNETPSEMYTCVCEGCYYVVRIEASVLMPYVNQSAKCLQCGEVAGWNVVRSLAWDDRAFSQQIELFEFNWSRWLNSDEGKLAQKKAEWGL